MTKIHASMSSRTSHVKSPYFLEGLHLKVVRTTQKEVKTYFTPLLLSSSALSCAFFKCSS